SPDFFFHKTITVVNPFKPLGLQAPTANKALDVQFFPEGGHLVVGLESKVGFRMVDQSGKGLKSVHGVILSQHSDTVASFSPKRFGLGRFMITPAEGVEYRAVIADSTGTAVAKADIPRANEKRCVLSIRGPRGTAPTLDSAADRPHDVTDGSRTVLTHRNPRDAI